LSFFFESIEFINTLAVSGRTIEGGGLLIKKNKLKILKMRLITLL